MSRIFIVSIVLLSVLGCGKRNQGAVSGTLTYKGQPVNGVLLHLYSTTDDKVADISIPVDQEGKFHSTNVPPGDYKIVVDPPKTNRMPTVPKGGDPAKAEEMKQKFQQAYQKQTPSISYPDKYKNRLNSDLTCTIKDQGGQTLTLEMK